MNCELVANNHLYPDQASAGRTETIGEIVRVIGADVCTERRKVNLRDLKSVQRVAQEYIESCARTPILPSKSGLCRALGYSRKAIWNYQRENFGSETEEYLSQLFDAFSEAYDVAAMGGSIHPIYAIFTQKAQYGLRDNDRPIEPKDSPLGDVTSLDELVEKYGLD